MLNTYAESSLVPLDQAPDERQIEVYDYASDSDLGYDTDDEDTESSLSCNDEVANQGAGGNPDNSLTEENKALDKPIDHADVTELDSYSGKEDGRCSKIVI